ncbi:unnamed protein product [Cochlearia groenlandica]
MFITSQTNTQKRARTWVLEVIIRCFGQKRTEKRLNQSSKELHIGSARFLPVQIQSGLKVLHRLQRKLHQRISDQGKKKKRKEEGLRRRKRVPIYGGSCRKSEMHKRPLFRRQEDKRGDYVLMVY